MAPASGELVPSAAIVPLRDESMIGRPLDGSKRGLPPARPKLVHLCDGSKTDRPPDDSKSDRRVKGAIGVRRVPEVDPGLHRLVARIYLGIDPIMRRRRWTERR